MGPTFKLKHPILPMIDEKSKLDLTIGMYTKAFLFSNNQWIPNSVPGVKAQPWSNNYRDGLCGQRKKDDDLGLYDPELSALSVGRSQFLFKHCQQFCAPDSTR